MGMDYSTAAEWGVSLLFSLPHLGGIALALYALSRPQNPQGTLGWILGLLLLPLITIPLYLALGAARIRRHTEERLSPKERAQYLQHQVLWQAQPSPLSSTLHRLTGYPAVSGNSVQLLQDGPDTYTRLLQAIRNASRSILLEFFIIRNDSVGHILREALEERARAGVEVCVIYDELGSHKLPAGYLRSLRKAGVRTASFNGRRFWLSSFIRLNFRNHRKLVLIDSTQAYLGSLNIGIEYTRGPHRPYWRDTFVRLSGPIVFQCLHSFAEDWHRATGQSLRHLIPEKCMAEGHRLCQLIPSGPEDSPLNLWQLLLLETAAQANKRLWLASPYFVPTPGLMQALQAAALRGVDVRLILPRRGDNLMAHLAFRSYLPELLRSGIRVLAYTPGFLHEKILLADDVRCAIGTANLDERSLRLNFELTLLMEDSAATAGVAAMLQQDMAAAEELLPEFCERSSGAYRLAANICRLFSPLL